MTPCPPTPIVLAGSTAAGKSETAIRLAELLDGEIISVDSMQVYQGLDIGSAKPTAAERLRTPHHLIDVAGLAEPFDAARFAFLARQALADIAGRGKRPILCGGTGFYFTALREGLGGAPPSDPALRRELEGAPIERLLEELARTDPATYEAMDRSNPRRVIRAVEVVRLSGRPFSELRAPWGRSAGPEESWVWFGLKRERADLSERVFQRVDRMFAAGLVAETERLLACGLEQNRVATQAIGYRQVIAHLRGGPSLEETIELVKIRTRQFAKRQMTWFRKFLPLEWVDVAPGESAGKTAERVEGLLREREGRAQSKPAGRPPAEAQAEVGCSAEA